MTRTLWVDPGFGASGDMLIGLLSALSVSEGWKPGALLGRIGEALAPLDLDPWRFTRESTVRGALSADCVRVETGIVDHTGSEHGRTDHRHEDGDQHDAQHRHRSWSSIDGMIRTCIGLAEPAKQQSRAVFERLALVEAAAHRVEIEAVEFHEVGAVDSIVDIVGFCVGLHELRIDRVEAGPCGIGIGTVSAAHGTLPLPAPATAALLVGVPVRGLDVTGETITPTAAALLSTLVGRWGSLPSGTIRAYGRAAGARNPATHPNIVSGFVVDQSDARVIGDPATTGLLAGVALVDRVVVSCNVDDATGEVLARTIDRLLQTGADDAWVNPIVMKKGRPAHEVSALCRAEIEPTIATVLLSETGSLGHRLTVVQKRELPRRSSESQLRGHTIRLKQGPLGWKPEFDDLATASDATGLTTRELEHELRRTVGEPPS